MNELQFWQQKLLQLTHDPVHKATCLGSGVKHTDPVKALFEELTQVPWKYSNRSPDHAASGADRPVFKRGVSASWRGNPIVTHPLQPQARLRSPNADNFYGAGSRARLRSVSEQITEWWRQQLEPKDTPDGSLPQEEDTPPPGADPVWNDAKQLKRLCLRVWRGTSNAARAAQLFGELLPADTRVPDHSLYDHVRVASALAFLPNSTRKSLEREPVLARFQVHGVQDFIRRSRKTRDLWTACMIYGELVWAAMEVIVEHYGPEAILYPDLLGNPYMDQWLLDQGLGAALPGEISGRGAATSAVPIPNTFGVLVPRGGGEASHRVPAEDSYLLPVEELMRRCEERVRLRWRSLADETSDHLGALLGNPNSWKRQFDSQIEQRTPRTSWTVVAWPHRMKDLPTRPQGLRALPAIPDEASDELPELLQRRRAALEPYVSRQVWHQYEHIRHVFWGENLGYLKSERGFDYPLVHRQLLMMHEATKTDERPLPSREQGAVCMLTGTEAALGGAATGATTMHDVRRRCDQLWGRLTDRSDDVERLGGPGAMKRYLAQVGRKTDSNGLIQRWNGVGRERPTTEGITAPFPSTAGIAAAPFLEFVCKHANALREPIEAFLVAVNAASQPGLLEEDSQHCRALPRLANLDDPLVARFVKTEPQYLSFDAMAARIERQREADPPSVEAERTLEAVLTCAKELRRAARAVDQRTTMQEQYAIVAVDVDGLSKLISGDPGAVSTTWEDILHPGIVHSEDVEKLSAEWRGLLRCKRGVGPSLHAMVTRALADFTDDLVPWVVEREFHGRVIYAGGDDALFMAPAHEAIAIAARLQQLLSAPWVVDTRPDRSFPDRSSDRSAVERFWIPVVDRDTPVSVDEPKARWEGAITLDGMTEQENAPRLDTRRIFPMLGRAMTLSAGIAFGHFKTPLQMVLDAALENQATTKTRNVRGFSISRFTSSGNKVTFSAPWTLGRDTTRRHAFPPPTAWSALRAVTSAIEGGTISARAPFELRETIAMVAGAHLVQSDGEDLEKARKSLEHLLHGVAAAADQIRDGRVNGEHLKPALAKLVGDLLAAGASASRGNAKDYANAAISGLLIARYFAGGDIDD